MYWVVEERPSEEKRSRTGWAVAVSALVYGAVGILILGADLITRLAAQASLSSDAMIALVLIGVLGWALWLFSPRRRRARRRLQ
jgi:ABC-type Mn2+/Zn2+ transport system permease subunit